MSRTMALIVGIDCRHTPSCQRVFLRGKYLNQKRIAVSKIARMFGRAIPARTRAKRAQKIYFSKELKVITRSDRAGLHKILSGVAGKPCAHKNIEDVMHMWLCLLKGQSGLSGQSPCQI